MLLFALWLISTSKGASLNYKDLVANVENTFDGCLDTVGDVGDYISDVARLGNVRRRNGDGVHADWLEACISILKATDKYRFAHSMVMAQKVVNWQEIGHLNNRLKAVSKKLGEIPIYVASKDGDRGQDFHKKCDGKGPTVVIIKTTTGNIFGGYTNVNWSSSGGWRPSSSFIFRLRPAIGWYELKSGHRPYAVGHTPNDGPIFGRGHDIFVSDNALNNHASRVDGHSYAASRHTLNDGTRNFQVEDYVVYKAIPL